VTRVVSSQGGMMVAGVKIHLGHVHRGKVVNVVIEDSEFRILHEGIQWPPAREPSSRRSPAAAQAATSTTRSRVRVKHHLTTIRKASADESHKISGQVSLGNEGAHSARTRRSRRSRRRTGFIGLVA